MKKTLTTFLAIFIAGSFILEAQTTPVDSIRFFTDEGIIEISLKTDFKDLQREKGEDVFQDADISLRFPDSTFIEEKIKIAARGHFRRNYCDIPPLMLNFRNSTSPLLYKLGKLKLVIGCSSKSAEEQLVLKEYLVYKMYNLIEEKSFRVRLARISYSDINGRIKAYTQYAFFLEDDADMARRNGCEKKDEAKFQQESTNREVMTRIALFQYMISNGDWGVPSNHNIKLIYEKDKQGLPIVVPYDFDHSGFVNADYALPPELFVERFGVEKVTDRVYRGFPRTLAELQIAINVFNTKKNAIVSLINNCQPMEARSKSNAVNFINEFYKIINDKRKVQDIFIDNARKD
jgi:hypothetical protein